MKNLIVTGGLGFIGSNLIKLLLKKNYFVINLDKVSYSSNKYNTKEFIASFMENVADGKIDLEKMDNQIAVLGLLFNSGLKDATNNAFDVSFSGEAEILQYFSSLGKAFKSGANPALLIKKLTDAVEVDQATERSNEPGSSALATLYIFLFVSVSTQ